MKSSPLFAPSPLNAAPRVRATVHLREHRENPNILEKRHGVSSLTALFLAARGITEPDAIQAFLNPTLRDGLPEPRTMKNLEAAARRILDGVLRKEKTVVFSDFDVDGISAASQLVPFLRSIGGDVSHYTPNRFTEGYGLSKAAVEHLAEAGIELLITVDCGATNHEAIAFAKERKNLTVIVIDHHQLQGESPADILVDPVQEGCAFREHLLCAAGIVWFLLIELRRICRDEGLDAPDPKDFLDLAALGTICDMVPLIGPNRVIASRGVERLRESKRPGILALKGVSRLSGRISAGGVSFAIGPRINAAGRLADASLAFELLTTTDDVRAQQLASKIDLLNEERKSIEERVKLRSIELLASEPGGTERAGLTAFDPSFHAGVIGIVAQRLVELFYRPAAVMAPGEMLVGRKRIPVVKGSVRSVQGFHVAEALKALGDLLLSHGGHSEAGGFSIEESRIPEFREAFAELASRVIPQEAKAKKLFADGEVRFSQIDFRAINELEKLQPFGVGNPGPLFVTHDVLVESASQIGERNVKLRLTEGNLSLTAVCWRFDDHELLRKGERISLAFTPELNSYQGITSVQLNVREVWKDDNR